MNVVIIIFCVIQSGIFSGLNLALLGISRLQLEAGAASGDSVYQQILKRRKDTNQLLATILWGNVATNTLLAIVSDSTFNGVLGFAVSVVLITLCGEIIPQAAFSRNLHRLYPYFDWFVATYLALLYPIAKPTALILDKIVGKEGLTLLTETELHHVLIKHTQAKESEIGKVEATGAMNFLHLDDKLVIEEGCILHPESIIKVKTDDAHRILFPDPKSAEFQMFINVIHTSGHPWVVLTTNNESPLLVMDVDGFLREYYVERKVRPAYYCHRPIIVSRLETTLAEVLPKFSLDKQHDEDQIVNDDILLYWGDEQKRIITGADILGYLLQGIAKKE